MSKELTDDWKNGNLNRDYFYVRTMMGNILIDNIDYDRPHYDGFYHEVSEVLAPVPDYDQFFELTEKAKKYDRIKVNGNYPDKISKLKSRIKHLLEDTAKLRHLLKEAGRRMEDLIDWSEIKYDEAEDLLTRINAAINGNERPDNG